MIAWEVGDPYHVKGRADSGRKYSITINTVGGQLRTLLYRGRILEGGPFDSLAEAVEVVEILEGL